ncbi:hypothetical protein CICLE_v10010170mg, partial [Citrus x clementina]
MAKQLSAFVLLLLIIFLLSSTMATAAIPPADEGELVRQFEHVIVNRQPIRPPVVQNREHNRNREQATDTPNLDGKVSWEGQTT